MLWEVDIYPAEGQPNRAAASVRGNAGDLHLAENLDMVATYGYLIETTAQAGDFQRAAADLLADRVVEKTVVAAVGDPVLSQPSGSQTPLVHELPKPGVMDPVAQSALAAMA